MPSIAKTQRSGQVNMEQGRGRPYSGHSLGLCCLGGLGEGPQMSRLRASALCPHLLWKPGSDSSLSGGQGPSPQLLGPRGTK